jgi:hypothetical protein
MKVFQKQTASGTGSSRKQPVSWPRAEISTSCSNRRPTEQVSALFEPCYHIDLDSIRRAFPPGTEPPPLLLDFAAWLTGRPWGSVGRFELVGQFSDAAPILDGSLLRNHFALFMRLPEGSVIGAWYGAGLDAANAPIVMLGSEGQNDILAASLEGLLARIARRHFEGRDFAPREDATDEMADWLAKRLGTRHLETLTAAPADLVDFAGWAERWSRDREAFWSTHPMMAEIAGHLIAHRPEGKNPPDRTRFEVAIVGRQFQVRVVCRGRQRIEEARLIEPALCDLRDELWRTQPALGLWYSMSFALSADGRILPRFDYDTRPTIDESPADLAEARTDLLRAPRPGRWVPTWLASP